MVFFVLLTLGFIFELGKNALTIDSRQTSSYNKGKTSKPLAFVPEALQSSFRLMDMYLEYVNYAKGLPIGRELRVQSGNDIFKACEIVDSETKIIVWYKRKIFKMADLELNNPNITQTMTD